MNISRFAIRHPAVITILMITLLLFGMIALVTMNQEFIPNVALPEIMIVTVYPGAAPEDVESEVTDVLEEDITAIQGLTGSRSVSSDSLSVIYLTFADNIDLYDVLPEIRAKIDRIESKLPSGLQSKPAAFVAGAELIPVFSFAVISDRDPSVLAEFVEDAVVPPLNQIQGVSRVQVFGGSREQLFIELQLEELHARGISALQVYEALSYANVSLPAGTAQYRGREMHVRISGEFSTLQEIRGLVVGHSDGEFIYLRDIAEVSFRYPDPKVYIESEGRSIMVVDIMKREDGSTPAITSRAKSVLQEFENSYGNVISFEILQDDSTLVRSSLMTVVRSGAMGTAMAVLVILVFLSDIRATLFIASSLPLSIVFAFIGMRIAGQSVNILSLSGLVVALGMVVDGSIVILENIYRHYRHGEDRIRSSERGTREVSRAVLASVSTSISVFVPLAVLTGVIGVILKDLSLTLVFALLGSLVVSLVTIPFFTSQFLKQTGRSRRRSPADLLLRLTERSYRRTLSWCLDHGRFLLFSAVLILASTVAVLALVGTSFIPSADTGEFYVYMTFPESYTIEDSREKVLKVEQIVHEQVPELTSAVFFTGFSSEYSRNNPVKNAGYAKILLPSPRQRERGVHEIIASLQYVLEENIADMDVLVENGGFDKLLALATQGTGFQIRLSSQNYDLLTSSAEEVERMLSQDPQIYKTSSTLEMARETAVGDLALDHLGALGFTSYEAAMTSRILLQGEDVGTFRGGDGEKPIMLGSNLGRRSLTEDILEQIQLVDPSGRGVSFGAFTDLVVEPSYSSIEHRDRMRSVVVTGYFYGEDMSGITSRTREFMESIDLPFGVSWSIGGVSELMTSSIQRLLLLMGLSVFLVYAVMVIQFERFTQPLIVMASIPFCLIGVVFGLLVFGSTLSIVAFLGIIALGGIVVNNAIVLIDYMNMLRQEHHLPLRDAVIKGASKRLRPILMTTLTTFFGVMPLALSRGEGSEVYAALGQAIAGGLLTSTLITLLLIPLLYYLLERRSEHRPEVLLEGGENGEA